jgi:hypothetical protein
MSARLWLNLGLLLLLAGLIALAVYEPGIEAPPTGAAITPLTADAITRIHIERRDQPTFTLEKKAGVWRIAPQGWAADAARLNALRDLVQEKSLQRLPASDLGRYGLEKPELIVTLNDTRIAFGDTDPISNNRYIMTSDAVHLVADLHYPGFNSSAASFAEPRLLHEDARVTKLALPDLTLTRDDKGNYTIQPPREKLSADAPQQLVDEWRNARALWVEADQVNPANQDARPQDRARITLEGAPELEYHIISREPDFVLAHPDLKLRYHFSAEQAQRLLELPATQALE